MFRASLTLLLTLAPIGCFSDSGSDGSGSGGSTTSECVVGSVTCPCTEGGTCDAGLECLSDVCVDPGGTSVGTSMGTSGGTSMTTGPTTDTATSGTGADTCAMGSACLMAPDGWNGPVAARTGDAGCVAPTPNVVEQAHAGLQAGPAVCECTCGAAQGVGCTASAKFYDATGCSNGDEINVNTNDFPNNNNCQNLGNAGSPIASFRVESTAPITSAQCQRSPKAPELPEPSWMTNVSLCGGNFDACGTGKCFPTGLPDGYDLGVCVWRAGEFQCPEPFTDGATYYRGVDDTRGCNDDCGCAPATGSVCTGPFRVRDMDGTCGQEDDQASAATPAEVGDCLAVANPATLDPARVRYFGDTNDDPGSCMPTPGTPNGMAAPAMPLTVCCVP